MSFSIVFEDIRDIERLGIEIKRVVGDNIAPVLDTALHSKTNGKDFNFLKFCSLIQDSVIVMSMKMFIVGYAVKSNGEKQDISKELDNDSYVRMFEENFEYYVSIIEELGYLYGGISSGNVVLVKK